MGAAGSLVAVPAFAKTPNANNRVRIAIIGCGNQGKTHLSELSKLDNCELVYLCDIDENRLSETAALAAELKLKPKTASDPRTVFDDGTVDGVIIALPDHWHVPAALLALKAGKHVYVEKPFSHNIHEGEWLREAADRSGLVLAHGTQSRASAGIQQAIGLLKDGLIGDVLVAKCWNWQLRSNIGHAEPGPLPSGIDYDTWVGPAEWLPYQENRFHYSWHWWRNFGCGGMGNDGIHEIDYALWGLGVEGHPSKIAGLGGKYFFDDQQQFPDTQQVTMEFDNPTDSRKKMFIYEQRLWSTNHPYNVDSGAEFWGPGGTIFLSKRGKIEVRDESKQRVDVKIDAPLKAVVGDNQRNWVDCIRSGNEPEANAKVAQLTSDVVHLGNISTFLGQTLHFDTKTRQFVNCNEGNQMLGRKYREGGHWSIPELA
ncbi:Gfo/Idh/MocA family protein [Aeoliella sp. SH292]|uniref:Gfo/Idh/MocA family protein n=1 Tax=Aeoliella sp. SH292 TaxID=3454464 RepID=UPI003F9BA526